MFAKSTYTARREILKKNPIGGLLLFLGHDEPPMNGPDNYLFYRQNSTFLYYFGIDKPGLAAIIDLDSGTETIYGDNYDIDDIVWMGPQESISEVAGKVGIETTKPYAELRKDLYTAKTQNRRIHFLPEYRSDNKIKLYNYIDVNPSEINSLASVEFIKAIIAQRSIKTSEEIFEIERAHAATYDMHTTAMRMAKPGVKEQDITGILYGIPIRHGGYYSFPIILSKQGEILHNHYHGNTLQDGDLLLVDCGAENGFHYAADITRVTPVNGKFSQRQRDIYDIVLQAENAGINGAKVGIPYREVHLNSAAIITEGLKNLGLMKGDTQDAVRSGAHALFFPHGLGHMMGLDVHDMEDLGEDYVGYDDDFKRSDQFGLAYLRLAKKLEPGFVLTVEPGIYFIPDLFNKWREEKINADFLNYDKIEKYLDFGGIRIEDDILITEDGPKVIGNKEIPKKPEDVEAMWAEGS